MLCGRDSKRRFDYARKKAHSCFFSKDAYAGLTGSNKELLIIPDTVYTDLYDGSGKNAIPFDKLERFFQEYLK